MSNWTISSALAVDVPERTRVLATIKAEACDASAQIDRLMGWTTNLR